jgi:hypothetical protein
MNDLVSEYQQYQDATAEGKSQIIFVFFKYTILLFFSFVEEGEGGEEEGEQEGA